MNLCVFQGTFNPVHNAHLRVAKYVLDKYSFDKIMFIPAYNPPHKNCDTNMSIHRLKMLEIALQNVDKAEVSDIEYKRQGISYTYLTICELLEKYKIEGKINFIIGTDAFKKIESWYESDKLKELVRFIVFVREENFDLTSLDYLKQKGYDFNVENLQFYDISSSKLRKMIKNNEKIDKFIDKNEGEYIKKHELYRN